MSDSRFNRLNDRELLHTQAFIDGAWTEASDNAKFSVIDPSTSKEIGTVPDMDAEDTRRAIAAAHQAFGTWRKATTVQRNSVLSKLSKLLAEHKEDLATINTLESGKAIGEVEYAQSFGDWFAEEAKRIYGDVIQASSPEQRYMVIRQPVGVCGVITPWNFPLVLVVCKVSAALAAGCTVVIKPAPETPYTALALAELAIRAGVPKGVINVITTSKHIKEVGQELCTNSLVRKIAFTGSINTGKHIMQQCATGVKRVLLELGGNAPFIVFDDADIEAAVEGLIGNKLHNAGQVCVAPNRIYVQSGIHEKFSQFLVHRLKCLRMGNGFDDEVQIGPMISEHARRKVLGQIEDAVKRGGRVLLDGRQKEVDDPSYADGFFLFPTVISEISADALVNREETFGPLLAINVFSTEEEAIALANNTNAGLAAYLYTNNVNRIFRMSEAIEAGAVNVNGGMALDAATPMNGVKESGIGVEGSKYGVEEYMNKKLIAIGIEN
ncbi:succinate-semialdehyde dehydrogenase [Thamnocephalis sphaerospora]|uniref:Succinate-semialdehyde dehydrogenase, mitochondrial n=1 Tax=Thamnocephalis sphaerospora TaxID=78915 RepID=A0A4P9XXX8_9FUNG|nr:succinate-semialdehyde dehydrogenase [Thamnocephalis sphaerospora]|eukprot:RKP11184.1 succinate-semialdehyde dehydrogenase [Thamnocephalis sphaerospora]